MSPDSEVRPDLKRRMLVIEYKLRIVAEAERSSDPGAIDAVSVIQDETMVPLTWQAADDTLDTAPGVDQRAAYQLLAEMGLNMRRFPTANHLSAWAGVVPG
ncbi:MAG: transposase, partial [Caldilinea sp.]